jgi:hypothetical protein
VIDNLFALPIKDELACNFSILQRNSKKEVSIQGEGALGRAEKTPRACLSSLIAA